MRNLSSIIVHCSATPGKSDVGVKEIRSWHLDRGFADIGYHYVIRRDGTVESGRPIERVGAHCKGHNAHSIGICLVGGVEEAGGNLIPVANFTESQWAALETLVLHLLEDYPTITSIHGHNEFSNKDCPCFDVSRWVSKTRVLERRGTTIEP